MKPGAGEPPCDAPPAAARDGEDPEETKARLRRRVDEARDAISETVGTIKETVEDQYATAKEAVTRVLEWRDGFQREPIVWSVGALTAGFALGYTLGTAERRGTLARTHAGLGPFADTLVRELGTLGSHLPAAALETIERVIGVDLAKLFSEMGDGRPRRVPNPGRRRPTKPRSTKARPTKARAKPRPTGKRRTARGVPRSRSRDV